MAMIRETMIVDKDWQFGNNWAGGERRPLEESAHSCLSATSGLTLVALRAGR
jgi:hypothetical protein